MGLPTPGIPSDHRFGLANRFFIVIDGYDLGGWSKCDGIAMTMKMTDYAPLGTNDYLPVLPDRVSYGKITLTRAITDKGTKALLTWLRERVNKAASGTGAIAVLGTDRMPVAVYQLRGVYPCEYKGPGLDAGSKNMATESLQLAHEGFL